MEANRPSLMSTQGAAQFQLSQQQRAFPNLGPAKRWSVMHHIETIHGILMAGNATPAF